MNLELEDIIHRGPIPKPKKMKGSREELLCPRCSCNWYNLDDNEKEYLDGLGFGSECTHELPMHSHDECNCFQEIEEVKND